MKIQALHFECGKMQCGIVQEGNLSDSCNAPDGFLRRNNRNTKFLHRGGVKRNTSASCVKDKIECIGIIV